ncbi:MAG: ribosome-associated translation inhibitor RaiA [Deltaproteobacteria bacterium]|nr:ribosome-associated translation inhibitor RaiA [Deltaproteobacteria bacterium]
MQFSVTFRHIETSDAVKEYAREKVERIKKYFPDPIMAHVVLSTERGYQHVADVNIQLHNGLLIKGREITEDMYSSIDLVMAKIERQVRRYKEKIRHHKARADLSEIPIAYHVLEEALERPSQPGTTPAGADEGVRPLEKKPVVVKSMQFLARPMTVDEAIMQMNLLENNFFVFRDSQTGQVNVVYRREDSSYGLIETGPPAKDLDG